MRRTTPDALGVCEHGYRLSDRGNHPDGDTCLPAGVTRGIDDTRLIGEILGAPSGVLASAATLDTQGLAAHLLRAGYRFADPAERHVVQFRAEDFTIKHPLSCRVGDLFDCRLNAAVSALSAPPDPLGRYECEERDGWLVIGERVG